MIRAVILAASAAVAMPASASEFVTGNALLERIQSSSIHDRMFALGYVAGASDFGTGMTHCPPPGVTLGQTRDLIKQALESTPSVRHHHASVIILVTLGKEFPCSKKPQGAES